MAFRPHPFLRNGHLQTLASLWLTGPVPVRRARCHRIHLPDGDVLAVDDDAPPYWRPGDPVVLLLHGLGGSSDSVHMRRPAARLQTVGIRTFRLNWRNCGTGFGLARWPYHAGRSEDARTAIRWLCAHCPGSPVGVVGYSLGGNVLLKMLGEAAAELPTEVVAAAAISPCVDLAECAEALRRPSAALYDWYFTRLLKRHLTRVRTIRPDVPALPEPRRVRRLWDFDDRYTAPVSGYQDARDYYARCSSGPLLSQIAVPTLILAAADDPVVPARALSRWSPGAAVSVHITPRGGQVGFLGRRTPDPDRHWLDWRIVDWFRHVWPDLPLRQA